jgi:ATP/maltotriose-dependent transcriptional regulator MalT/DNA-binding SARP family transcriptional activator
MQTTLNAAKYTAPRLPSVITRERLLKRLRAAPFNGVILLLGQAAQGKSTLAADYLRHNPMPTAWVCLDAEDGALMSFYTLLVRSLVHALPAHDLHLFGEPSRLGPGSPSDGARAARCLSHLLERLPDGVQIVLDGLDRLPAQAPALQLVRQVCVELSHKGRVWLLSRRELQFRHQHELISRRMCLIGNEELAFDRREIEIYFEAAHRMTLPEGCAALVQRATGGWPGGLVLLAQSLERVPSSQWVDFLSHNLPERLSGKALRYFSEEVFNGLPPETGRFLTHAAVLDVIDPALLGELLDDMDCGGQLEWLVRNNIFTQSFYDSRLHATLYRFNQMFAEFLRARFRAAHPPQAQQAYYARIAALYDARGDVRTAVRWYIQAQDFARAAAGLTKISTDLVIRGCLSDLAGMVVEFPEEHLHADPWLFFLLTLTRRMNGGARSLEDFKAVMARFAAVDDLRGQMLALAYLIEDAVLAGQPPAVCLQWIREGERWLASQSDKSYYAYAKSLLWLQIGFGYIAGGLDLTKGLSACQNAFLLARKMNDSHLMARAAVVQGLGLATAGAFESAEEALTRVGPRLTLGMYQDYDVLRRLVDVILCLRRGDLYKAEERVRDVGRDIEACGLLFLYPAFVDAHGFLQLYQGRYAEARQTCRHLLDVAVLAGNPVYRGQAHRLSGLIHYFQGNYAEAAVEAQSAIDVLAECGPATMHLMRARQLLALACIHLRQFERAGALLDEALAYFRETVNHLSEAETYLIMGLMSHAEEEPELCADFLSQGFEIAQKKGFDRFVLLSPLDFELVCTLGRQAGIPMPLGCECGERPRPPKPHLQLVTPAGRPDTGAGVPENAIDIRTFGGFKVLRGGEPIADSHWGGHRPKLLLKSMLVHGLREIPKDILIEDLWPDSGPQTGLQNFKVTLHRLRRVLEPGLKKIRGSGFVHLRNNRVSLDPERCRVDLEDFLQTCKDIKRCAFSAETDRLIVLGRRVMELYQGDFLPEEPYAPWVEMKRWALKDAYIEALMQMASVYRQRDDTANAADCCRAALRADPCREPAAQLLMGLLARQGRRNEALQVYTQLRKALNEELGLEPEPATATLLERIATGQSKHTGS